VAAESMLLAVVGPPSRALAPAAGARRRCPAAPRAIPAATPSQPREASLWARVAPSHLPRRLPRRRDGEGRRERGPPAEVGGGRHSRDALEEYFAARAAMRQASGGGEARARAGAPNRWRRAVESARGDCAARARQVPIWTAAGADGLLRLAGGAGGLGDRAVACDARRPPNPRAAKSAPSDANPARGRKLRPRAQTGLAKLAKTALIDEVLKELCAQLRPRKPGVAALGGLVRAAK
ncbi:unnamed protein product, partial [Prorocentrum cordatum]